MQASEIFEITNPLLFPFCLYWSVVLNQLFAERCQGPVGESPLESLLCVLSRPVMSNLLEVDSLPSELDKRIYYHLIICSSPCKKSLQPCSASLWETILIHFPSTFPTMAYS